MALISTAGATNANSYVNEATATAYLTGNRLHTALWVAASTADREAALIWATDILDTQFDWIGSKRNLSQSLRWPRSGARDLDGYWLDYDAIPAALERGTAELAHHLLQADRVTVNKITSLGLKSIKAGSVAIEIDALRKPELIPHHVFDMLRALGNPGTANGGGSARLIRT